MSEECLQLAGKSAALGLYSVFGLCTQDPHWFDFSANSGYSLGTVDSHINGFSGVPLT